MSTKQKLDELMKEDDVFLSQQDKFKIYFEDNWKELTAMVVGVFLILGGFNYYQTEKRSALVNSSTKLASIVNSPSGEIKTKGLETFIAEEGAGAVQSQARLILAVQLYTQKNFQAALENYSAVATSETNKTLKDIARLGKAYSLIELKNYAEAITTLEKMKSSKSNFPEYELDIQIARCKEELGDKAAAVKIYENLSSNTEVGIKKGLLERKIKQLSE